MAETAYVRPFESMSPTPCRCGSSSGGSSPRPAPNLRCLPSYSYHAFITDRDGRHAGSGGRPSPPRRDRERHPRPEVRRGAQPSSLGTISRQRRLAGRPGHGPQFGPLDWAHRSGQTGGNHQNPAATLLRPGRTAHPQGPAPHPASAPGMALAKPIRQSPFQTARPATPYLTASDPSAALPNRQAVLRQVGPGVSPAASWLPISPATSAAGLQKSPSRGSPTPHPSKSIGIKSL